MFGENVGVNCFDFQGVPKGCSRRRMAFNTLLSVGTTFLPETRVSTTTGVKGNA